MSSENIALELALVIKEALPQLAATPQKLRLNGNSFGANKVYKKLFDALDDKTKGHIYEKFGASAATFDSPGFDSQLFAELFSLLNVSVPKNLDEIFLNSEITTPLKHLKIMINFADPKNAIVYDELKDLRHIWNHKLLMERLSNLLGDDFGPYLAANSRDCKVEYRPYQPRIITGEVAEQVSFNTWEEAEWRKDWVPDADAALPAEVSEFFDHLFVDKESREMSLAWLRDCTFDRAQPILILVGVPGCGKNIFVESIAAGLVGVNNYDKATRSFGKSNFHGGVGNKRLFLFDEVALDGVLCDTLKDYHNGFANLEEKYEKATGRKQVFSSFALAQNDYYKIHLKYSERKFYVPNLTDSPFLRRWDRDKIDEFVLKLKDDKYLQQIASYLYYNFSDGKSKKEIKTDMFKKICIKSYPPMFQRFILMCETNQLVKEGNFTQRKGYTVISGAAMESLIREHELSFGIKLADFSYNNAGNWEAKSLLFNPNNLPPNEGKFVNGGSYLETRV